MTLSRSKWAAALSLSLLVHAGAAAFFAAPDEEAQIAGGQQAEAIVLGNSFEDMASAGEPVDTVEAIQPEAEAVEAEPVKTTEAEPVETPQPQRVEAEPIESADAPGQLSPGAAPRIEPVPSEMAAVAADAATAVQPRSSTAAAVEPEPVEPAQTDSVVAALAPVPVPTPRPAYTPPPAKKAEAPPAKSRVRQAKPQQARAGSGGGDARDAKAGASDGGSSATGAVQRSEQRAASAAGNAAVSNYPGKIASRLRRSLRYPSEAKRKRITGEVHVRFVVHANGAAGGIAIVRSSGSPILDRAAVETVQRAAPFPAIPSEAGRNSWPFTIPLAFTR